MQEPKQLYPLVVVDIALFCADDHGLHVLLVKRANDHGGSGHCRVACCNCSAIKVLKRPPDACCGKKSMSTYPT